MLPRPYVIPTIAVVSAIAGFFIHTAWDVYAGNDNPVVQRFGGTEVHLGMKGFVNPLLDCGADSVSSLKEAQIRESVEAFIKTTKESGAAKEISVYYRDLNNGPTFGIDSNVLFTPASLLKVPIMISYLHKAEKDPSILKMTITYDVKKYPPGNIHQNIERPEPLTQGQAYTIEDLLVRMITRSDNFAAAMLAEEGGAGSDIERTLKEMGVPLVITDDQVWLTVKNYASMFRILFNSTYLQAQNSSVALELLSKSVYDKGLASGVPPDVVVSHKFGERAFGDDHQLHDCGIVYAPKSPYLLCVMTRGKTFEDLTKAIHGISDIVYKSVAAQ